MSPSEMKKLLEMTIPYFPKTNHLGSMIMNSGGTLQRADSKASVNTDSASVYSGAASVTNSPYSVAARAGPVKLTASKSLEHLERINPPTKDAHNGQKPSTEHDLAALKRLSCISGILFFTVHKLVGLSSPANLFIEIEVESFDQFCSSVRTSTILDSASPQWNQVHFINPFDKLIFLC